MLQFKFIEFIHQSHYLKPLFYISIKTFYKNDTQNFIACKQLHKHTALYFKRSNKQYFLLLKKPRSAKIRIDHASISEFQTRIEKGQSTRFTPTLKRRINPEFSIRKRIKRASNELYISGPIMPERRVQTSPSFAELSSVPQTLYSLCIVQLPRNGIRMHACTFQQTLYVRFGSNQSIISSHDRDICHAGRESRVRWLVFPTVFQRFPVFELKQWVRLRFRWVF